MSKQSTALVHETVRVASNSTVDRRDAQMGDVFELVNSSKGRLFEHTGVRTCPPSEVKRGQTTYGEAAGKTIIGFQSRVVKGRIKTDEDGARVSFKGTTPIKIVGRTRITLELFS